MRNYGLIKGLSAHHQVSLLSFCEPGQSPSSDLLDPLLALCRQVETVPAPPPRSLVRRALDTLIHRLPDMALRLASPTFTERLTAWLARESFDVVHVEGIEMTPYLDLLLGGAQQVRAASETGRGRGPLVIFDDHNCEYMLQKSYAQVDVRIPRRWAGALYSLIQWQKLRNYEASVCRRAHHVLAVSQTDAEALQQLVPDLDVTVIPNGIDTDQYETYCLDAVPDPVMSRAPGLVFTGKMDFRPNVDAVRWFAEMIWPQVRDAVPEARFFAVGQHPHPQLDDLGVDPSLTLTGWVEDVRPYIAAATVYVAPLRMGSGTRLKLLEAMALGKAIVSTRLGAEGLTDVGPGPPPGNARRAAPDEGGVTDDRELVLVADDDASAFANAVVALLGDPARRDRLGAAGKTFVKAHYDWRVIIPRLEALYVRD